MEGESHFHPCPGCSEAVECQLVIGDEGCGKLRCANCSPQPNTDKNVSSGHLLTNTWVCVNGCTQPGNGVTTCPKCGAAKPAQAGKCEQGHPISVHYSKCFYDHPIVGAPAKTETAEVTYNDKCSCCNHC